jgi:protein gp37
MDGLQLEFPAGMFAGERGLPELLRRGCGCSFLGRGNAIRGLAKFVEHKPRWTGEISFHEDILQLPLRWTKPRKVFVNSMSDLFHEKVTDEMLDKAFAVMALTPQHTYQILTKRPERMNAYLGSDDTVGRISNHAVHLRREYKLFPDTVIGPLGHGEPGAAWFPLLNVWLGVSVEDQKTADERIPLLLDTPAEKRWVSAEPLLDQVDLEPYLYTRYLHGGPYHEYNRLDWVVTGGESGHDARSCDLRHLRLLVRDCKLAGVAVFVKQLGADPISRGKNDGDLIWKMKNKKGGDMDEWPEDLRVREYPRANTLLNSRVSACEQVSA